MEEQKKNNQRPRGKALSRGDIIKGNYQYPTDLIKLKPTRHFNSRRGDRTFGLSCLPKFIRVSPNNIHSGKTIDGVKLTSVVVRIKYSSSKNLFICLNPFDGAAKSMWIK